MTYPPQQPGQPGQWGQQPDPYGGQGPWGQQPDPYGGQSPWGQQPYQMGPPPPKKKGGLMAALIIVAVLLVGGGGAGLYFLLSKDDKDAGGGGTSTEEGPRAAADAFAAELEKILNDPNVADVTVEPLKPYMCADDYTELDSDLKEAQEDLPEQTSGANPPPAEDIALTVEDFKETDDGATFTLRRDVGDNGGEQELKVVDEDGNWVVCGFFEADEPSPPPPSTGGGDGPDTDIPNPIPTT